MFLQIVGVVTVLAGIAAVAVLIMAIIRLFINSAVKVPGQQLNFDPSTYVVWIVICLLTAGFVLIVIIGLLGSMSNLINY